MKAARVASCQGIRLERTKAVQPSRTPIPAGTPTANKPASQPIACADRGGKVDATFVAQTDPNQKPNPFIPLTAE